MQTKFDAREDVVRMIEGYAAEERISKKDAINALIEAGWRALHEDVIARPAIAGMRDALEAVLHADRRDREDQLDEMLAEMDALLEPLRELARAACDGGGRGGIR